jgi:hypothetical protein
MDSDPAKAMDQWQVTLVPGLQDIYMATRSQIRTGGCKRDLHRIYCLISECYIIGICTNFLLFLTNTLSMLGKASEA